MDAKRCEKPPFDLVEEFKTTETGTNLKRLLSKVTRIGYSCQSNESTPLNLCHWQCDIIKEASGELSIQIQKVCVFLSFNCFKVRELDSSNKNTA